MRNQSVFVKANLLSNGIKIDNSVLNNFKEELFVEKRRAFGNQDPKKYLQLSIPQEIYILPDDVICAVNVKDSSTWRLIFENENYYVTDGNQKFGVKFPKRPLFYDKQMSLYPKINVNQILTLYGGNCLGIFANRFCSYAPDNICHFCSLTHNHGKENNFLDIITPDVMNDALNIALNENYSIKQIAITGGIYKNLDENFEYFFQLAYKARQTLDKMQRSNLDILLVISPPTNKNLLKKFKGLKVKVAMDLEVYRKDLFQKYCPGKDKFTGYEHFIESLIYLVDIMGYGNVYSLFVGGLEPISSLKQGAEFLASHGIVPVVNVLHVDPETKMTEKDKPSVDYILKSGEILQNLYSKYKFEPFYNHCGRNSLDTEAYQKMFY